MINNAGSVAHSVAGVSVATSCDGNAMILQKLHCRREKNIARVSVAYSPCWCLFLHPKLRPETTSSKGMQTLRLFELLFGLKSRSVHIEYKFLIASM